MVLISGSSFGFTSCEVSVPPECKGWECLQKPLSCLPSPDVVWEIHIQIPVVTVMGIMSNPEGDFFLLLLLTAPCIWFLVKKWIW
jgi:hypothetical protein